MIARIFDDRNHTTVISAVEKIRGQMAERQAALRPGHPAAPPAEGGELTCRTTQQRVVQRRAYPVPRCAPPPQIRVIPQRLEQVSHRMHVWAVDE